MLVSRGCCNGTALVLHINGLDFDIAVPAILSHEAAF